MTRTRDEVRAVRAVLSGSVGDSGLRQVSGTSRRAILVAIIASNVIGAAIVVTLLGLVLPLPVEAQQGKGFGGVASNAAIVAGVYVVVAVLVGRTVGLRLAQPVLDFYLSERDPTPADRRAVLRLPLVLLWVQSALWGVAVVVFGLLALSTSELYAFEVAVTTALGGIPTACLAYLLTQRLLRAATSVVLADAPPKRREVPGVGPRAVLAWALGTVPVGGIIALSGFAPVTDMTLDRFALAAGVLSGVSVGVGLLAVLSSARAVADPLKHLRDAFGRIEGGDYDVEVPVFDATEVGYASAGFNRMAAGLREREKLRDLFGRQVGADVARRAMEQGVTLGGEERFAAALFVDVIGSTSFAADRAPTEVVAALNDFFEAVVGATQQHGGLVNKFIGDAALCVFGAPLAVDDAAGSALAAARDMARRLEGGVLRAGIGVAAGTVVAGNVGSAERYEYTVIGDPVNEAARLTELAKDRAVRVLASAETLDAAGRDERACWRLDGEEVTLRGRSRATRLATPS